jgi:hypothetical protein
VSAIADEILAALESPRGRALLVAIVRQALETRDTNRRIDAAAVARKLALTPAALRQLFYRRRKDKDKGRHPLEELARTIAGKRTWLEADVDNFVEREAAR